MRRVALVSVLVACSCLGPHAERSPPAQDAAAVEAVPADANPAPAPGEAIDEGLPAPLPPPEPPPVPVPEPPPPAADLADPMDLLWGHRLEFASGGEPLIAIGLMDGQREIAFRPRGPARILLRGGGALAVPAGVRLIVRTRDPSPARMAWSAVLDEPLVRHEEAVALRARVEAAGLRARVKVSGSVYGIAGRVVDTRRERVVVEGDGTEVGARSGVERLRARGLHAILDQELVARPSGKLVLLGPGGAPLGEADVALSVLVEGDAGVLVEAVEHAVGSGRAREDRSYVGRLYLTLDPRGLLAAVHGVSLEELLRGIVPSEMPASSPMEALKAQAVTARSNVLAQIGVRHLDDPFMLCAEVHCQAYRGDGARTARTDEAVRATRGQALFGPDDRRLVDGVYSAMCGGYGEDNDAVWGAAPSASLRGHPDLPPEEVARWSGGLVRDRTLRAFLSSASGAYCRLPAGRRDRFRWERRLDRPRLLELGEALGVGRITSLEVLSRGASGRARALRLEGAHGTIELGPELRIRRALGDLPSAMFVVDREGDTLVLRGGGWGHGVGLCQWGAVGRAMTGQGYQEILRAYFSGAEVVRVY
jgi:stage II sporulation protein D